MVRIVESGQPFSREDVERLNLLLANLGNNFSIPGQEPATKPVLPPLPPATTPATPAVSAEDAAAAEMTLCLNLASDGDLLREFITELRERLDNTEQSVLVLENRSHDAKKLNTIFHVEVCDDDFLFVQQCVQHGPYDRKNRRQNARR